MSTKYKHIRLADVYVSLFPKQLVGDEPQQNSEVNK